MSRVNSIEQFEGRICFDIHFGTAVWKAKIVRYIFLVFFLFGTRWISHKLAALQLLVDKFGVYLQHLQSMSEDKSFKSADCQKFKGWLKKWQQARIPLTASLFIELLSPAKALSLAFQEDEIDIIATISCIETAKQQLERLERKDVEDLPTVKRFLEKVQECDGQYCYQNVTLSSFEVARQSARQSKNMLLGHIKEAMQTRLEVAENSHVLLKGGRRQLKTVERIWSLPMTALLNSTTASKSHFLRQA